METKKAIDAARLDGRIRQKSGVNFIAASVIIWSMVAVVQILPVEILTKNLLTFFAVAPLVPIALGLSKLMKIDFSGKGNPLTMLGVLFSINQMLYLVIAMWIFQAVPDKMVMVVAIIFGAHLLPFGWLYQSKIYYVMSAVVAIGALGLGLLVSPFWLAISMVMVEIIFCLLLYAENRKVWSKPQPNLA